MAALCACNPRGMARVTRIDGAGATARNVAMRGVEIVLGEVRSAVFVGRRDTQLLSAVLTKAVYSAGTAANGGTSSGTVLRSGRGSIFRSRASPAKVRTLHTKRYLHPFKNIAKIPMAPFPLG